MGLLVPVAPPVAGVVVEGAVAVDAVLGPIGAGVTGPTVVGTVVVVGPFVELAASCWRIWSACTINECQMIAG